jgi:hypothetical protein
MHMRTFQSARRRRPIYKTVGKDRLAPQFRRSLFEQLEQRRLLSGTNLFSGIATSLQQEVASIQSTVDNTLQAASSLKSLPFIGQQLGAIDQVQNFFDNAGNTIQSKLTSGSNASPQAGDLQNALWTILGTGHGGLGIVTSESNIIVDSNAFKTNGQGVVTAADVEIWIHEAPASINQNLTFNLGLPALPFKVTSTGGLTASVGVDLDLALNYSNGSITIDSSKNLQDFDSSLPAVQLAFSVTAGLSGIASLTADLGLLRGTLTPTQGQQNSLSASVTVANLGSPSPSFTGSAQVNLTATLGLGDANDSQAFPSISTNVSMNWPDLTNPASLAFSFGNVQLNLGQFISGLVEPVLADIQQYTKPFQGAIDDLNTPIPGIDSVIPGFSVMTLAGGIANYTGYGAIEGVVADALEIANEINGIDISSLDDVSMPMGDFDIDGSMIAAAPAALDPTILSNLSDSLSSLSFSDLTGSAQGIIDAFATNIDSTITSVIQNAGLPPGIASAATSVLDTLAQAVTGGGGASANIDFPIFDNPKSILNLLFGQDVDLVAFNASFDLSLPPSISPPGASYLGASVGVTSSLDAEGSLKIGYDTYGLRELLGALETGTPSAGTIASDIADGFYIQGPSGSDPGSHVTISGSVSLFAGASVNFFGVASASLDFVGGLNGDLSISLNNQYPDTANDGRIRFQEIVSEIDNGQVFDASGDVTASLSIVASASVGPINESQTLFTLASTTLYDSGSANSVIVPTTPPPVVSGVVDSDDGPLGGGTSVTICGADLDGATAVSFGLNSGTIISDSDDQITAVSPAGDAGTVDVTVTTPGGTSQPTPDDQFTYDAPPTVTGITPTSGAADGIGTVAISGTNLIGATEVEFGETQGYIESASAGGIVARFPAGTGGDSVQVTVITPGGMAVAPENFVYLSPPVITSISPDSGPQAGGTILTIHGTGLENAVQVNGVLPSAFLMDTDTEIQIRTLSATNPGPFNIRVEAGDTTSAVTPADVFTYVPRPVVSGVSPGSGPTAGGTVVISGTDLGGATAVDFGPNAGTIDADFQPNPVSQPTLWQLIATAPMGTAGLVNVTATTTGGTSAVSTDDQFDYIAAPIVVSAGVPQGGHLVPASGPLSGGTKVRIEGYYLNGATQVLFGQTPGTILGHTAPGVAGTILAESPAATTAGTVDVTVVTPGGTTAIVPADQFTYSPLPVIDSLTPNVGPYEGGTTVTIQGEGLDGATAVDFGANPATIVSDQPTELVVTSPAGALGDAEVTVTTPGGTSFTPFFAAAFYYEVLPAVVTGVTPSSGQPAGGDTVTIAGTNLLGATAVEFGAVAGTIVSDTATQIVATNPAENAGTVDVTVLTPGEVSATSPADQFTYISPFAPVVSALSVSSGSTAGGTAVTITGTYLANATAVDFGGNPGMIVFDTPNAIQVTSPSNYTSTVDVTVSTPDGVSATLQADQFTYQAPAPVVTSVGPNTGAESGGTTLTISGSNLSGAFGVFFGFDANNFPIPGTIISDTANLITVKSPPEPSGFGGFSGTVDVMVETPGGLSALSPFDEFTYGAGASIGVIEVPSGNSLLTPAFGPVGGGTTMYILGANLEDASAVYFGGNDEGQSGTPGTIQFDSANEIQVVSPGGGEGTERVRVATPDGFATAAASSDSSFTFTAAPVVTELTTADGSGTAAGPAAGGATVTISGFNLSDATAVDFGGIPAASFTIDSDDAITAVSPASSPGSVTVTVTSPEGTSAAAYTPQFVYLAVPTVSAVSPAAGPLAGGSTVEVVGTGLTSASEVDFDGIPATASAYAAYDTDDTLFVTSPAGMSLGAVDVTVTTPGGASATSSADQYSYDPPPVITSMTSPASLAGAVEGGTPVTITGSNLAGATAVYFGQNPGTIVSDTDSQIVVISPTGDQTGTVDVTVVTATGGSSSGSDPDAQFAGPAGQSAASADQPVNQFTYNHAPFIASLSLDSPGPIAGPIAGGTTVYINGIDLDGATEVDFGQVAATIVSDSANTIEVTSPASVAGTIDVTVTTPNGTSDLSTADQFTYFTVPSVSGISPSSGSILGGTTVMIAGTDLAGATEVDFGNPSGTGSAGTIISDTDDQILVVSPSGYSLGTVCVTVTTPGGTSAMSAADQFTYVQSPNLTAVSPASGSVYGGDTVTIDGYDMTAAESVFFGSNLATILSNTDGEMQVLSPEATGDAAGAVDVTVVTQYGTSPIVSSDQFTYASLPVVTGVSQSSGSAAGGTAVVICGNDLDSATAVNFGDTPASSFYINSDGTITAYSPAGSAGDVEDITVVNAVGTSATSSADQFTYGAAPSISSITPAAGSIAGGTQITIAGSDLAGATAVDFNDGQGDDYTGSIVSNTESQIVVTSPYWGYAATVDVIVTTADGTSATTPADEFTYTAAPSVLGLDVTSGSTLGGDLVTITGTNLANATAIDFGPNAGTIVSETAGQIQALSPTGSAGVVDVTVVTAGGTSATTPADEFTYFALPPTVAGLSLTSGPAAGGTTVTIIGANFDDASAVDFGSVAGEIVSITSTQIVATSPAGVGGMVDVTVTTPGGVSDTSWADQFTYITAPAVDSLSSSTGPATGGGTVYVYGSELQGATAVNFGQTAGTIVADGSTFLIAAAPAGSAGTVDVTVTTSYGMSATSPADLFTYVASPTTAAASFTLEENTMLSVAGPGVLAGDIDPQGLPLSAELLSNPADGTLSFGADGSFTYTPEAGYFGADSFTYQADNGYTVSSPTTVSLTIVENDPFITQVTNTADSGPGSLRQALLNAAADTSGDLYTIQFALPSGSQTIDLQSPLPTPTDPVLLSLDATQNVTLDLAGSVSDLTEGANITNSSMAAAGIEVSGTNQVVGAIDGTGNLVVDAGSDLTADSVVQNTLTIGAGATVTIAPSGSGTSMATASATSEAQSAAAANGTALAERIAEVAARRAQAAAAILASEGSHAATVVSAPITIADSSTPSAPVALAAAPAEPVASAPAANVPAVASPQVVLAAPSQVVAAQAVSLPTAVPTVLASRPQAIAVVQQAPAETLPSVLQESLSQIGFAAREDVTTIAMFAANFSPPVASNPVPTATAAGAFGNVASTAIANSAVALTAINTSIAGSGSDTAGRSAVHAAIDAALEDGACTMFGFDESLLDLLANRLLGS